MCIGLPLSGPPSSGSLPPASRWRWRPGVVVCLLTVVGAGWIVFLNADAAAHLEPYAMHGRGVQVAIDACRSTSSGGRTCLGDYTIAGRKVRSQQVQGADSALVGMKVGATVDGRHPGTAVTGDVALSLVEVALLALAGLAVMVAAMRAAGRAWHRRRTAPASRDRAEPHVAAPGLVAPNPTEEDPLAWVRHRRFGAGTTVRQGPDSASGPD